MEYSFTDWDSREYKRKTGKELTVSSQPIDTEKLTINFSDAKNEIIKLVLSQKEAKAISLVIEAAINEMPSKIELITK